MTSSTTTADLTQEFIAKVRGLAIDTLIFVENFTDEGAVWELNSVIAELQIAPAEMNCLQEEWFTTTDHAGESMSILTKMFPTTVINDSHIEVHITGE
ncbi:hypothetical protein CHU70_11035 (plasmid) [Corynebacterium sp. LK10]|uniref:hypothetical protein n=1 Tax=Corynebacterium sp. LK10 TaxID=2022656 RepID=UPI0011CB7D42|nr:hypothetical protein [Corynebacterium sp. LK10]TXS81793.1 hypothetical protein CHU70_11035 [Corynebacterium sp. LK10]